MTGIDLDSTYTYLLEEASDRTSDTWEIYMLDRKDRGLNLKSSVNDGGVGLMSGIPKAFDDIEIQPDTFHIVFDMGKEVSKIERKAVAQIKKEDELKRAANRKRPRQKAIDELQKTIPQTNAMLIICDTICILYAWLKELLGFSGYNAKDTAELIEFVLSEMGKVAGDHPKLLNECAKVRKTFRCYCRFYIDLKEEWKILQWIWAYHRMLSESCTDNDHLAWKVNSIKT